MEYLKVRSSYPTVWKLLINLRLVVISTEYSKPRFGPRSTIIRFQTKNGAVLLRFQKDLRPHLSFSCRFRPSTLQCRIRFENAFIPSVRMLKWTRRMRISIYRLAKLARTWSHMVASVRHFGYSRSSGLARGSVNQSISQSNNQSINHLFWHVTSRS